MTPPTRCRVLTRRRVRGPERGLTLVETTLMLSVLFILVGAMSPVVSDSLATARQVRAQQDIDQIANGLVNLLRDVGTLIPVAPVSGTSRPVVQILASDGETPALPTELSPFQTLVPGVLATSRVPGDWASAQVESIDDHLRRNLVYPQTAGAVGPSWNGPYVSEVIEEDPWGQRYMVNSAFSVLGGEYTTNPDCCAVFVVSAGPDGIIDTPFQQPISSAMAFGDDIAVRIQ